MRRAQAVAGTLVAGFVALAAGLTGGAQALGPAELSAADAPARGIWVDALDLADVPLRRPRGRGRGQATPPPAPVYRLGDVTYAHAVPLESDRDLQIDLHGAATRFDAMVGIDAAVPAGRGSVIFGVWVDGRRIADSGLMRGGDAPKHLTADLRDARRLVLAVVDGNDGTGSDSANWGGALITMRDASSQRPAVVMPAAGAPPPIASSRSAMPLLNYPRITGATPGRPFMFLIPASGEAPLRFEAANLPEGLTLDADRGLITGSLARAGRTTVHLTVSNARGRATGDLVIVGGTHALAQTPPLGWNSWNAWGNTVTAERVRASADGMVASGLDRQGYAYINIDDVWEGGERRNPASGRDAKGEITTNDNFPDMPGLVNHIHSLGLKAGIYSSPGPTTCQGLVASFDHEAQDAKTWAAWGFDYLKYDWCSYQGDRNRLEDLQRPYRLMRGVLDSLDRDVVFSICQYGWGNVWEWGREVGGNLWRMTGDIRDNWPSMSGIGFQQTGREAYAGPGGWNDTDMLVVGMVGWSQGTRPTDLTPDEQLTHISLWALQAAPMLIGADLAHIDQWTTDLLGNREMLAVNQDELGKPAGRRTSDGWTEVWSRPMADGTTAVGLFNRGPEPATVTATWADLGLTGTQPVRDIWRQRDLPPATGTFEATVPRHGVVFVRIGSVR
ncbi:MAG: NPCBM/NEW2 domain-containing protein [Vicinamibacterales bacterium]